MQPSKSTFLAVARSALLVLVAVIALAAVVDAETTPVRLVGAVQWIGGQRLALILDNGASVPVDLAGVDQASYRGVITGDRLVVTGTMSSRENRVAASAISPAQ